MCVCECGVDVSEREYCHENGNWRPGGGEGPVVEGLSPLGSAYYAEYSERGASEPVFPRFSQAFPRLSSTP